VELGRSGRGICGHRRRAGARPWSPTANRLATARTPAALVLFLTCTRARGRAAGPSCAGGRCRCGSPDGVRARDPASASAALELGRRRQQPGSRRSAGHDRGRARHRDGRCTVPPIVRDYVLPIAKAQLAHAAGRHAEAVALMRPAIGGMSWRQPHSARRA
jgi:hypothetical protein